MQQTVQTNVTTVRKLKLKIMK